MTFFRRAGLTGAVAGTFIAAMIAYRSAAPSATVPTGSGAAKPTPTATPRGGSSQPSAHKKNWQEDGPWIASRQHFAGILPEDKCPSLEDKAISDALVRSQVWCIPDKNVKNQDVTVRAMIAIVPDPVHSHLALAFDRTIEALQLSAETMNYEMDRYWLPWRPATPASSVGAAEQRDADKRGKEPGLLVFRWNGSVDDPAPKVLYVFLVADTSTSGVNGSQFSNAVQYVLQVCGPPGSGSDCTNKNGPIFIMGPTFSGSLASLRKLSDAPAQGGKNFTAYSGTVSSLCAIKYQGLLDENFPGDRLPPNCPKEPAPSSTPTSSPTPTPDPAPARHLTVASLVGDAESMVRAFIQELEDKGNIDCKNTVEVAILSEASTAYGRSTEPKPEGNPCPYTSFRYPREISNLRNASASSSAQPAAPPPQSQLTDTPAYLPFTLADQQPNYGDEAPDFSQAQGPLSKEAVLMKYAAELRREHYKYVGIIGTNVVDVLYLVKFLRSACPDVRVFILDSDLLFERDLDNAPYIGTLALSTYPLLGHDPEWHDPRNSIPRLPLSDQYEQGLYNASLLAMQGTLQDEPKPDATKPISSKTDEIKADKTDLGGTAQPRDVIEPFLGINKKDFQSHVLPIWLTAVGTGGYWPIQLIPHPGATVPKVAMDSDDFSQAWRLLSLLLAAFAFMQSWVLWSVPPVGTRFHDFSLINEAPAQRFFFINLASASLACTLALFMAPALKFGMYADRTVPAIAIVMLLAIATLVVCNVYLWLLLQRIRQTDERDRANRFYFRSACFSLLAWAGAVLCVITWWRLYADDPSHYGFFYGYRSVNLASGVSPLTPMLLLLCAVFLWSMFEIWRLRFDNRTRPWLSQRDFPAKMENDIACSINEYLLRPNYRVIFVLVFAGWLFFLQPANPFELFEKPEFGWIYESLFLIVVALMLSSGLRLAQTWEQLQHLLRQLERSPIRGFLGQLKEFSWSPIWQSGGQPAEWTNMARSFEVMQRIKTCNKELDPDLSKHVDGALSKLGEVRSQVRSASLESFTGPSALKQGLARVGEIATSAFKKSATAAAPTSAEDPIVSFRTLEKLSVELQDSLVTVLEDIMMILQKRWTTECYEPAGLNEASKEDQSVVVNCCKDEPDEKRKSVARLEEYVALRYVAFIRGVLVNIRLWLILQAIVFSLVLSSLNVYSFEPHRSLVWSFTALFVLIGAIAVLVLMDVHKDPIISRITGTKPNKLDLQFFIRIAALGAVPLLTLLATHFPSIGHYLLSLFQPGLEALK
jgi:hypothetical protein